MVGKLFIQSYFASIICIFSLDCPASTGLGSLQGLYEVMQIFIISLGALAAIFLAISYKLQKKQGKSTKAVVLFATPVILYAFTIYLALFVIRQDIYTLLIILESIVFIVCLIFLFIKAKSARIRTISAFFFISFLIVLTNPGIFNFWVYAEVDNDPFNGEGIGIKKVVKVGGMVSEDNGKTYRVDQAVILEDGTYLPGVFSSIDVNNVDKISKVIIEKKLFGGGYHPYQVIAFKKHKRPITKPIFDIPIFLREYEINRTYVVGWAYKVTKETGTN